MDWGRGGDAGQCSGQPGQGAYFHGLAAAWLVVLFGLTLWMQFKEMDLDPPEQAKTAWQPLLDAVVDYLPSPLDIPG